MVIDPRNLTDREILTLTIIGEARGEGIEGQVAVGAVIRNRLHANPKKYRNYADVCLEKLQFSCWNPNDPNRPLLLELAQKMIDGQTINDPYLRQCKLVANAIIDWDLLDNTRGAVNYMTTSLFYSSGRPSWAKNPKNTRTLGSHTFFNV